MLCRTAKGYASVGLMSLIGVVVAALGLKHILH